LVTALTSGHNMMHARLESCSWSSLMVVPLTFLLTQVFPSLQSLTH
jgi:hypothetical protein